MFSIHRDKLRKQWLKRGGYKDPNSQRGVEIRQAQKKMYDCMYVCVHECVCVCVCITILYIFIMINTCQRFRTIVYNIKQEGPEGKLTKLKQKLNKKKTHKEKEAIKTRNYQRAKDKMAIRRPHISIITLNVNGLNSPIIRYEVVNWIKKQNPTIYCQK